VIILRDLHPAREQIDSLPSGCVKLSLWTLADRGLLQMEHKYVEDFVRLGDTFDEYSVAR
jgi:hypothetical protein